MRECGGVERCALSVAKCIEREASADEEGEE